MRNAALPVPAVIASSPAIFSSPRASARLERARAFLAARRRDEQVLIVGATLESVTAITRRLARDLGASFGWHRATIGRLAATLAAPTLAERGLSPVGRLPLEALSSRVVFGLRDRGALGRFGAVAAFPGLPRALARTLLELRLEDIGPATLRGQFQEFVDLHTGYEEELARARLADRALVFRVAIDIAKAAPLSVRSAILEPPAQLGFDFFTDSTPTAPAVQRARSGAPGARAKPAEAPPPSSRSGAGAHVALLGLPMLILDVPLACALERELVEAMMSHAPDVLMTVPGGDDRTLERARQAFGAHVEVETDPPVSTAGSLSRLQSFLFSEAEAPKAAVDDDVVLLSAPGESRECVEIARIAQREAERGTPFDRMAILLRAPGSYRVHLEEALHRARIPAYFTKGSVEPDPSGRAFLALLGCAQEQLSARRFAEYLSLGQVPDATAEGGPPAPLPDGDRWVPPDEELARLAPPDEPEEESDDTLPADPDAAPVTEGTLRTPWRWERLLVESAVIGGLDRWEKRLAALDEKLRVDIEALAPDDDAHAERLRRTRLELAQLSRFALPLLGALASFPAAAKWGDWLDRLSALATSALRRPDRVLSVLAELAPMAQVGPVELGEVVLVLGRRLTELVVLPRGRSAGHVFVAPIEAARGLSFDVVFVPGLAEKIFPQKVVEDPILRDEERRKLGLDTNRDRALAERLALHVAVGAAEKRLVLSYPRVDMDHSRPRVPSFYGLEVLRASEGSLPGFDELARRAERQGSARIGWPAPAKAEDAIDRAEYDLAQLDLLFRLSPEETVGAAHYLLNEDPSSGGNEYLPRALRFRARRWNLAAFTYADGLVDEKSRAKGRALHPSARAALDAHGLTQRSFSPTALQTFASCPYRFLLHTVHKLAPREVPEAIEEIDALDKGSLVHEVLFELVTALRDDGLLPIRTERLDEVRDRLDRAIERTAREYEERLAPAIDRVWRDGIESIKADLREWLRREALAPGWTPAHLELSFGLAERRARDKRSRDEAVELDCGIRLRGSIDVVERAESGRLRATDYKTGKKRAEQGTIVGGGETLQPVLYALVLEKLFPEASIEGGRLYYTTSAGGFEDVSIVLNDDARRSVDFIAKVVGDALRDGFLPAAPAAGACKWCDYRPVCGPQEEARLQKKLKEPLAPLKKLRELP
jgi:ATP-dependent helicase/nuclease subunit B